MTTRPPASPQPSASDEGTQLRHPRCRDISRSRPGSHRNRWASEKVSTVVLLSTRRGTCWRRPFTVPRRGGSREFWMAVRDSTEQREPNVVPPRSRRASAWPNLVFEVSVSVLLVGARPRSKPASSLASTNPCSNFDRSSAPRTEGYVGIMPRFFRAEQLFLDRPS